MTQIPSIPSLFPNPPPVRKFFLFEMVLFQHRNANFEMTLVSGELGQMIELIIFNEERGNGEVGELDCLTLAIRADSGRRETGD